MDVGSSTSWGEWYIDPPHISCGTSKTVCSDGIEDIVQYVLQVLKATQTAERTKKAAHQHVLHSMGGWASINAGREPNTTCICSNARSIEYHEGNIHVCSQ